MILSIICSKINSQSGSYDEDVMQDSSLSRATPSAARGEDGVVNLQNVTNSTSDALFILILIGLI